MLHQSTTHFCISQFACNSIVGWWLGQKDVFCVIDGLQKVWVLSGCNNTWDRTTLANANLYAHHWLSWFSLFLSLVCERHCIQCLFCCYFGKPCIGRLGFWVVGQSGFWVCTVSRGCILCGYLCPMPNADASLTAVLVHPSWIVWPLPHASNRFLPGWRDFWPRWVVMYCHKSIQEAIHNSY